MGLTLYYSPGACSLSPHIALREAGLDFTLVKVNLKDKVTEDGADYWAINAKGSVPCLKLEDGSVLTEGPAIVQYIGDMSGAGIVPAAGTMERYRLMEWLNFVTSELHKGFGPIFGGWDDDAKERAKANLKAKFAFVEKRLADVPYLMGDDYCVADGYLFTVLRWGWAKLVIEKAEFPALAAFSERMAARPGVAAALEAEGL